MALPDAVVAPQSEWRILDKLRVGASSLCLQRPDSTKVSRAVQMQTIWQWPQVRVVLVDAGCTYGCSRSARLLPVLVMWKGATPSTAAMQVFVLLDVSFTGAVDEEAMRTRTKHKAAFVEVNVDGYKEVFNVSPEYLLPISGHCTAGPLPYFQQRAAWWTSTCKQGTRMVLMSFLDEDAKRTADAARAAVRAAHPACLSLEEYARLAFPE